MNIRNINLLRIESEEHTPPEPITYGHNIFSVGNIVARLETTILEVSLDAGLTFTKTLDVSVLPEVRFVHIFTDESVLVCSQTKAYYSKNWQPLTESTVTDIAGNIFVPTLVYDNFTSLNGTEYQESSDGVEMLVWGNYNNNDNKNISDKTKVYCWYTVDGGETVKMAYEFNVSIPDNKTEPLKATHMHGVNQNPTDKSFWLQTGDELTIERSHWVKGDYNFSNDSWVWTWIGSGDYYKSCGIYFHNDYIIYASDIRNGGVSRVRVSDAADAGKHEALITIINDAVSLVVGPRGDIAVTQSRWFGSDIGYVIHYSPDEGATWVRIITETPPGGSADTIFIHTYGANSRGKVLTAARLDYKQRMGQFNFKPSVWLDDIVKNNGFPNAFKPQE